MSSADPTVRISITIPSSLYAELEQTLGERGWAANRSQAVAQALRSWLADLRDQRLRHDAALLDDNPVDDENLDAAYEALRRR